MTRALNEDEPMSCILERWKAQPIAPAQEDLQRKIQSHLISKRRCNAVVGRCLVSN